MPDLILLCAGAAVDLAPVDAQADALRSEAAVIATSLSAGAFARAFARGTLIGDTSDDSALPRELPEEAWLRARFGVPAADSIEAWSARAFERPLPAWHATPVHVEVGHYQLVLTDPAELALSGPHAQALADAARPLLADAGFELTVAAPLHWFLTGHDDWSLDAHSWTMAVGRSIDGHLPAGAQARDWRRVFTDVQIAWHDHPVTREREARRMRPVNALWLDGRARGPLPPARATVFTRDRALAGLASAAGCRIDDAALDALTPARLDSRDDVIVDVDLWRAPRSGGDAAGWLDAWQRFDRWLTETGLDRGAPRGFGRLRAVLGGERRLLEIGAGGGGQWRLWRRFDALAAALSRPAAR